MRVVNGARWVTASTLGLFLVLVPAAEASGGPSHGANASITNATSKSWSGLYALAPTSVLYDGTSHKTLFEDVSTTFEIPVLDCAQEQSYLTAVDLFAGLDGWTNNRIEQIGVEGECANGNETWLVFWQTNPLIPNIVPSTTFTVSSGDLIYLSVQTSRTAVDLTLRDENTSQSYSVSAPVKSLPPGTSAECIVEAPLHVSSILPLSDFGTVDFFRGCNSSLTLKGSGVSQICDFPASSCSAPVTKLNVKRLGTTRDTTSIDPSGDGFSVIWVQY